MLRVTLPQRPPFIVDNSIKQAYATQAPVAFILSPLLTGGNSRGARRFAAVRFDVSNERALR